MLYGPCDHGEAAWAGHGGRVTHANGTASGFGGHGETKAAGPAHVGEAGVRYRRSVAIFGIGVTPHVTQNQAVAKGCETQGGSMDET